MASLYPNRRRMREAAMPAMRAPQAMRLADPSMRHSRQRSAVKAPSRSATRRFGQALSPVDGVPRPPRFRRSAETAATASQAPSMRRR